LTRSFELLETMRWTPLEGWYLLDRHLARLEGSARHFGFTYRATPIRDALDRAVRRAQGPSRVRLLLAADGSVNAEQTPLDPREQAMRMRVRLATEAIDSADVFLFHKTTNRGVYERARRPDCDDVILWNGAGEATESTIANLVVEDPAVAGRLVTPPVACGLLPGTLRAELLATGEVAEAPVTLDELRASPRFWLVNSVRGWCPATWAEIPAGERA
jgi:branched-subunit amino acid aminotransferase/4-amino-4-deoxychorismate lyase